MVDKVQEINIKLENGDLNYKDAEYLIIKIKEATGILERIAVVSKNAGENQYSITQALDTVKNLTANFIGK